MSKETAESIEKVLQLLDQFKKEQSLIKGIGALVVISTIVIGFSIMGIIVLCRIILFPIVLIPVIAYFAYAINLMELMK